MMALVMAQLAGGCASKQRWGGWGCPKGYPSGLRYAAQNTGTQSDCTVFECQQVERQKLAADVSRVSYQTAAARRYCNLPEKEAQCLAAMHAPQARLLEQEADAAAAQRSGHQRRDSSAATEEMLRLQAAHERNRNASAALQLLYRIAAAETGIDNGRKQLAEVRATAADLSRLQRAGLDVPLSMPETEARRIELEHKLGELDLLIDQLNEQLATLLGVELAPGTRFWPDIDLQVDPNVPGLDESQITALAQRADLAALRVAAGGGAQTMRTAIGMLGVTAAGPLAGASGLCWHLFGKHRQTAIREEQLAGAVSDKERAVRNEVARAVGTVQARLNLIVLAQQRLESLREHREEVRQKSELPAEAEMRPMTVFDVRRATIAELLAEQDLFQDVIEWKVAVVKLKEAEGELAVECGYMEVFNYSGCCR
jgi:hypothetical protein